MQYRALLARKWLAVTVALVAEHLITVAATALVMQTVIRWRRRRHTMDRDFHRHRVYLAASPLLWLTSPWPFTWPDNGCFDAVVAERYSTGGTGVALLVRCSCY